MNKTRRKKSTLYVRCPRCGEQGWIVLAEKGGFVISHYNNKVMINHHIGKRIMTQILNQFEGIIE